MAESDFKNFFQKLESKAYTGANLKRILINANSMLAPNYGDIALKNDLFISLIYLAKNDIELYIKIMNLCMENSLYCFNRLFVHSSIFLIYKKYSGEVSLFDINDQKIFYNIVSVILQNEILNEIDIVNSCDATIILGKSPNIFVPYKMLTQFEDKIFEILNKKYRQTLIENKFDLESDELINHIRKLDIIYNNFGKSISYSSDDYRYSESNSLRHFKCRLSPSQYDEKISDEFGILMFPLISEIEVLGKKIIIKNDGLGNLDSCNFTIVHKESAKKILETNLRVLRRDSESVYIDTPIKQTLLELPGNNYLEFRLHFKKFNNEYGFTFEKKIGPIQDELDKPMEYSVNYDLRNNNGNIAFNSNNVSQTIVKNDIKEFIECYNKLAELIDKSDMSTTKKEEAKTNIDEAIKETSKEKWDFSRLEKITGNLATLVGVGSKIYPAVEKIKDCLWHIIQNNI